jgi:hypothetical protein
MAVFRQIHVTGFKLYYASKDSLENIVKKCAPVNAPVYTILVFLVRVVRYPEYKKRFRENPTGTKLIEKNIYWVY